MLMLKRMLLFVSSFTIIGITIQLFVVMLAAVNAELFLLTPGLQSYSFVY